jgi:DNA replication and repair protein RecF
VFVNKLILKNFRNIIDETIILDKGINIIYGNNAQGKTNIIEALYLFTTGKSFRTKKDNELINFNRDYSEVNIFFNRNNKENTGNFIIKNDGNKQIKINYTPINRIGKLMGFFNAVIFAPIDLSIIKDGPAFRRRFIDIFISQIRPSYFFDLQQYSKILKQRNSLLKKFKNRSTLMNTISIWDEKLSEYAERIINLRNFYINKLNNVAINIHNDLTQRQEEFNIKYESSFNINFRSNENIKDLYISILEKNLDRDIDIGFTQYGPHRDELIFNINNMDVKKYASQGQQRSIVLTLKMSECNLIKEEIGEYPIILLDDIMSELDKYRQNYIINNIVDKQVIITGTDINKDIYKNVNLINIREGRVI